jgi:hypothetical protein
MVYIPGENNARVDLIMRPGQPSISWKELINSAEPCSVAIDGYVLGKTRFSIRKKLANFDHHAYANPIAMHAACGQVYNALLRGFYDVFRGDDGNPRVILLANHNCPDVATCYTLLKHGHRRGFLYNDFLHKLVTREDCIDSASGAIPFEEKTLRRMAWVYEPYTLFRSQGRLDLAEKDPAIWSKVIFEIEERILEYINGHSGETELDMRYEIFCGHEDFVVAKEVGTHPKTGLFRDGYKIYVLYRERPNGRFSYSIGILSVKYSGFNLRVIANHFNKTEDFVDPNDKWGGGNSIIGSGWLHGSSKTPKDVANIMLAVIDRKHKNGRKKP